MLQEEHYRGKNTSKRRYFYGFKVQVITTADGLPVAFYIHAGSFADVTALQAMPVDLPLGSQLYADSAYTSYELEDLFYECDQVKLLVCRKSNACRKDEPWQAFLKNYYRKRIETTFSGITTFFPKKIHAVTPQGFILKITSLSLPIPSTKSFNPQLEVSKKKALMRKILTLMRKLSIRQFWEKTVLKLTMI